MKKYHGNNDLLNDPNWDISDLYVAEEILDERTTADGTQEYLVHWEGYDAPEDYTWEPLTNLKVGSEPIDPLKRWFKKRRRINALLVKFIT